MGACPFTLAERTRYIHAFAGGGAPPTGVGDGGLATDAVLSDPERVLAAPDGSVYIAEHGGERIRRVTTDGLIRTVAGTGTQGCSTDTGPGPATTANLWWPEGIAARPDGSIYVAEEWCGNGTIRRIAPPDFGATMSGNQYGVPSQDGSEMYVFSGDTGRQVATYDAITNKPIYAFDYGTYSFQGASTLLPTAIHDLRGATNGTGRTLTIQRDSSGQVTGFQAAGSQTTGATVTGDFLTNLARPLVYGQGSNYAMTYDLSGTGLLKTFTDPNSNPHSFEYDTASGKLTQDHDPNTGAPSWFKKLSRTELTSGNGHEVQLTSSSSSNLVTKYRVESQTDGSKTWQMTTPDNRVVLSTTSPDGSTTTKYPDGTTVVVTNTPDPRFGMNSPVPTTTLALPSGRQLIVKDARTITGYSATDPLNFTTLQQTDVVKKDGSDPGLTYTTTVTRNTSPQTVAFQTPEGRKFKATLDSYGRVATIGLDQTSPVVQPVSFSYDSFGRVTRVLPFIRELTVNWGSNGFPSSLWSGTADNPQMLTVGTTYDDRGQLANVTRTDGDVISFGYDANGNLKNLLPPPNDGFALHTFTPTGVDLLSTYDAPDVTSTVANNGQTHYYWDTDRRLTQVTWTNGTGVKLMYFPQNTAEAGKLSQLQDLNGSPLATYSYVPDSNPPNPGNGRVSTISTSANVTTSFGWDGPALTSLATTWPSALSKTAGWQLGDYLRVTSETATGGNAAGYAYDNDGLITHASVRTTPLNTHDLSIARDPQTGWVSTSVLKNITQTVVRDPFYGQVTSIATVYNATTPSSAIHATNLTYDTIGRIYTKSSTEYGLPITNATYTYDTAGRLQSDGTTSWGYDSRGNRTQRNGVTIASYDLQDRLKTYNGATFTNDANGNRTGRTQSGATTTYTYDAFNNLKSVSVPSLYFTVFYDIDGLGRRVGRHRTGLASSDRYYLYGEGNRILAEYDGSGNILSRFVYATHAHVPDYMIQGLTVYRFVTDELGSVRLIVNDSAASASASVVKRIDYDAWGNITYESGSIVQPFGFAGGIQDRDTGLVHFGARDYDPATGRWVQKDPIRFAGGDTNLYAYAGNDPVNRVDPDGRFVHILIGAGAGALFGGGMAWATGGDVWAGVVSGAVGGGVAVALGGVGGGALGAAAMTGVYDAMTCGRVQGDRLIVSGLLGGGLGWGGARLLPSTSGSELGTFVSAFGGNAVSDALFNLAQSAGVVSPATPGRSDDSAGAPEDDLPLFNPNEVVIP